MDKTVPPAAAVLLDFIRKTEVGTEDRSGYDVIYGHNQGKLEKPITECTVDEVLGQQRSFSERFKSSATGGYQFMRNTLQGLKDELGLRGTQVMDPDLQDRLGFHLLRRRGYDDFASGRLGTEAFGKRLAQEWASMPVLAETRGAHRTVSRGQSYYTGDALNKSLVKPETFERVIHEAYALRNEAPPIADKPAKPEDVDTPATPLPDAPSTPPSLPPVPAPVGTAVSPEGVVLTPMEQMNKPVQGTKANFAVSSLTGALLYLWSTTRWFPEAWNTDPQAVIALTLIAGTLPGIIANFWASYKARDRRFQTQAAPK